MIYIRSTLANIGVYGCLLFGCVVSSAMGLFSRKSTIYFWNYFMIPVTMFVLRLTAGIKIEIRGRQHLRQDGVIYASKHESALETYCMSMFIKKAVFILKKELTYIPIFGWAQHFYGMIPVNRAAGGSASHGAGLQPARAGHHAEAAARQGRGSDHAVGVLPVHGDRSVRGLRHRGRVRVLVRVRRRGERRAPAGESEGADAPQQVSLVERVRRKCEDVA